MTVGRILTTLALLATPASAAGTKTLVVTLNTSPDTLPETFCVISEQVCKTSFCNKLEDLKSSMHVEEGVIRIAAGATSAAAANQATFDALARGPKPGCAQCTPSLTNLPSIFSVANGSIASAKGFISCARNSRPTKSTRVAITYLQFHTSNTPAATSSIELIGNQVVVHFSNPIEMNNYEFLVAAGGDYLDKTVGLGAKDRMQLDLVPACIQSPIHTPSRVVPAAWETLLATLNDRDVNACLEESSSSLAIWLPYQTDPAHQNLKLTYTSWTWPWARPVPTVFESVWTERAPPVPIQPRHRQLELTWQRHCLAGSMPESSDAEWNAMCPAAVLPTAGTRCAIHDYSADSCRYRCEAAPGMSAFALPTPVRFERKGTPSAAGAPHRADDADTAYSWPDTLSYAGQQLTSFSAASDQMIIVELPEAQAWRRRAGSRIDSVEIRGSTGAIQSIKIGQAPPRWRAIPMPGSACSDQFSVRVVGARTYYAKLRGRDHNGNLVLGSPRDYEDRFHWALVVGGGVMFPRNQLVNPKERVGEFYGSIGVSTELYYDTYTAGALELTALYEPTYTHYGVVRIPRQAGSRLGALGYHRGIFELAISFWGDQRVREGGVMIGAGLGGPMYGHTDQVGTLRFFALVGGFFRLKLPRLNVWAELNASIRLGEKHQFYGTDENGEVIPDTFHGEPGRTERALPQIVGGLRFRTLLR